MTQSKLSAPETQPAGDVAIPPSKNEPIVVKKEEIEEIEEIEKIEEIEEIEEIEVSLAQPTVTSTVTDETNPSSNKKRRV